MLRTTATLIALMLVANLGLAQKRQLAAGSISLAEAEKNDDGIYLVLTGSAATIELETRSPGSYVALQARDGDGLWSGFDTGVLDADGMFSKSYEVPDHLAGKELEFRALVWEKDGRSVPTASMTVSFSHGANDHRPVVGGRSRVQPMQIHESDKKWFKKMQALGLIETERRARTEAPADEQAERNRIAPSGESRPVFTEPKPLTEDQKRALKKKAEQKANAQDNER